MHSELIIESRFDAYSLQLREATKRSLEQAALVGIAAVKATPTSYRIETIMDTVSASGVEQTSKGLGVWLIAGDWRTLFFERGTYKRHRGKLAASTVARRATPSGQARLAKHGPNRGVKAAYFLRNGAIAGCKALPALLERECSRIR